MRIRIYDREKKIFVPLVTAIKLDHLGEGYPTTFVADGKEWSIGSRFEIVIESDGK